MAETLEISHTAGKGDHEDVPQPMGKPHGSGDHGEDAPVTVGWLTRSIVKRPCTWMCGVFSATVLLALIVLMAVFAGARGVQDVLGSAGFLVRNHPTTLQGEAVGEIWAERYTGSASTENEKVKQRDTALDTFTFLYEDLSDERNMLTKANVLKMASVEKAMLAYEWETHCKLVYHVARERRDGVMDEDISRCESPATLLNYLYKDDAQHEKGCKDGFCMLPFTPDVLELLCESDGFSWGLAPCASLAYDWREGELIDEEDFSGELKGRLCGPDIYTKLLLDKANQECKKPIKTTYTRSQYSLGWPLEGYDDTEDRESEQFSLNRGGMFGSGEYGATLRVRLADAIDAVSVTTAEDRIWRTRASGDKTINAYYRGGGTTGRDDDRQFLDVFMAAGSVCFVFLYIWANVGSLFLAVTGMFEIIMAVPLAWFFWRILLWQKLIDFISMTVIFLILCIGADDIFVYMDTWKSSISKPPHISGSLETRLSYTYKVAASAMFTTTCTTVLCLGITATARIPFISTFGIFAALVVLCDYILVITWFPITVVVYATYIEKSKICGCLPCCRPDESVPGEEQPERPSVVFLREKVTPVVYKWRKLIFALAFLLFMIFLAVFATRYQVADDFPPDTVDGHPLTETSDIIDTKFFQSEDWKYAVWVVYGFVPNEPVTYVESGQMVHRIDVAREYTVNYDPDFKLDKNLQEAIVEDCEQLRKDKWMVENKQVYCLLNLLRSWKPEDWPYEKESDLRKALDKYLDSPEYEAVLGDFADYGRKSGFVPDGDDGIKSYWHSFNSTIPQETKPGPESVQPHFDKWEAYTQANCAAPCFHFLPGGQGGDISWALYILLSTLVQEVWSSIMYSLAAAFFVLNVTTLNWYISTMVVSVIIVIIICVLSTIFAIGNTLGVFESVFAVLCIGLAIDYAVHIAHFYNHSPGTRFEKTQESVSKIAISVIGGAATTVFAGVPLFLATGRFNYTFGFFILFTSGWAVTMTFIMLVPWLMMVGPEGDFGSFEWVLRWFRKDYRNSVRDRRSNGSAQ